MIELIVVRHGETDWNLARRLQGHTDIALNPTGIEQAARLAAALAGEHIASVHSSDLGRALATARPVAAGLGLDVVAHRDLRERNYGILEGKTFDEIVEAHPEEAERLRVRDAAYRFTNGESAEEFAERTVAAIRSIASAEAALASAGGGRKSLVVAHGGVLDMLYRVARDLPIDSDRAWLTPNAAINRLDFDGDRFAIREWATIP